MTDVLLIALVLRLGGPDFAGRQRADAALAQLLPLAAPALAWGAAHPDAEVAGRCRRLLDAHADAEAERLSGELLPRALPLLPWVDMMPADHPQREQTLDECLRRAREDVPARLHGPGADWQEYRAATRLWLRDRLHEGLTAAQAQAVLDAMAAREHDWIRTHRLPMPQGDRMPRASP